MSLIDSAINICEIIKAAPEPVRSIAVLFFLLALPWGCLIPMIFILLWPNLLPVWLTLWVVFYVVGLIYRVSKDT